MHEFTGHDSERRDLFYGDAEGERSVPPFAFVWDRLHSTWVRVYAGQWVLRGTAGEYYPCEDDGTGEAPMNYEQALFHVAYNETGSYPCDCSIQQNHER